MTFIESFRPQNPHMKICMMGPKAVGKTTVLTAVFNETQNSISGTSLNLTAKGDTNAELIDRLHMLHAVFLKKKEIADNNSAISNAGITASSHESKFDFGFGRIGKDPIIDLTIKDFPGEMIVNNKTDVIEFIKDSECIFIAIDTPHLMENNGVYNSVKNKPEQIIQLFENAVQFLNSEKLVIFIPLKCEKYFHEQRMEEVLVKVEETYATLIKLFESTHQICCCVSPILTLGDVEFDDFSYENGNVKLAPDGCPSNVRYKYVNQGKYSPFFCSQPLYSLLLFVAAQYKRNKDKKGIIDTFKGWIWDIFHKDETLIDDILKMNRNRISDDTKLGYKVLCGGNLFSCKK